jgi:hypothetical protein
MSTPTPQSTELRAFVDARFVQQRMVSESITSAPSKSSATPQQVQVRADVGSTFSVALDDAEKPTGMIVEIEFRVELKLADTDKNLLSYLAKHTANYKVLGWTGFDDWATIPEGALGPYFSMSYGIAQQRAEHALLDMGLRGIALPRANTFDEYANSRAGGIATSTAAE